MLVRRANSLESIPSSSKQFESGLKQDYTCQGQALLIRVKYFFSHFWTTETQKRQRGRNDRKTRKINRQKDTRNIDRKYRRTEKTDREIRQIDRIDRQTAS